jgi:hypothetical protein
MITLGRLGRDGWSGSWAQAGPIRLKQAKSPAVIIQHGFIVFFLPK